MAERAARSVELAAKPGGWQRVLHGDSAAVRSAVVRVLLRAKTTALAFRYAACGLADTLVRGESGVHCSPRGCGHRLCPRCGRKRGGRYARRIMGWLAYERHGELWSIVLTQRVRPGELVRDARARMASKNRAFMRWITRVGMTAGMTTTHIVWSKRKEGWHYHVHCLLDVPAGLTSKEALWDKWKEISGDDCMSDPEDAVRLVRGAGPPIESLKEDGGDPEFWKESRDVSARAVQYPMRDLAQGVSAWRLGGDPARVEAAAEELVISAAGWKLFRAWGAWRKACPAALAAEKAAAPGEAATAEDEGAKKKPVPGSKGDPLGTVRQVWFAARRGEVWARDAMRDFEKTVSNASDFARRFVRYCRLAWEAGSG